MLKENGKWGKERRNERKKFKEGAWQRWMKSQGSKRQRKDVETGRNREATEGEGGLLETGKSKGDYGGQGRRNENANKAFNQGSIKMTSTVIMVTHKQRINHLLFEYYCK